MTFFLTKMVNYNLYKLIEVIKIDDMPSNSIIVGHRQGLSDY